MPILDLQQKDIVAAMKAKEEARLSALRMIKTALHKAHVDWLSRSMTRPISKS